MGKTWPEDAKGWLISYDITLAANEHRVTAWVMSFDVPANTRLDPQQSQWYRVIEDGLDGTVVIASPAGDSHTIDPEKALDVNVQVLYQPGLDGGEAR